MNALRIHEFGDPARAVLDHLPTPDAASEPAAGQVRVRIEAAAVNPLDLKIIAGAMQPVFPVTLPYTVGTDLSGVVEAVAADVTRFQPGDRVFGRLDPSAGGAFAQKVSLPAAALCAMPPGMSHEQAAALPTSAGTAWFALFDIGQLQAGQRVLIHAAAGGVGSYALQFAKQAGAEVVVTASTQSHGLMKELGADLAIDHHHEDFAARVQGLDLVLDTRGGDTLARSWSVLRPGGRLVSVVDHAIVDRGELQGRFAFFRNEVARWDLIAQRFAEGQLQVVLDTIHPLDDARAALAQVAQGHARGKVIVRMR